MLGLAGTWLRSAGYIKKSAEARGLFCVRASGEPVPSQYRIYHHKLSLGIYMYMLRGRDRGLLMLQPGVTLQGRHSTLCESSLCGICATVHACMHDRVARHGSNPARRPARVALSIAPPLVTPSPKFSLRRVPSPSTPVQYSNQVNKCLLCIVCGPLADQSIPGKSHAAHVEFPMYPDASDCCSACH
jgi:hypothetical protein